MNGVHYLSSAFQLYLLQYFFYGKTISMPTSFILITATVKSAGIEIGKQHQHRFKGSIIMTWWSASLVELLLLCGRNSCYCSMSALLLCRGRDWMVNGFFFFAPLLRLPFASKSLISGKGDVTVVFVWCGHCFPVHGLCLAKSCHLWMTGKKASA